MTGPIKHSKLMCFTMHVCYGVFKAGVHVIGNTKRIVPAWSNHHASSCIKSIFQMIIMLIVVCLGRVLKATEFKNTVAYNSNYAFPCTKKSQSG